MLFDVPSYLAEDRLSVETVEALVAALSVRNDCSHPQGQGTGLMTFTVNRLVE